MIQSTIASIAQALQAASSLEVSSACTGYQRQPEFEFFCVDEYRFVQIDHSHDPTSLAALAGGV